MFNKYWREYPFFLQLFLLVMMIFTLFSASTYIALTVPAMLTGVSLEDIANITKNSSPKVLNAARLQQLLFSLPYFAGVALLYAYASYPKPMKYLGFNKVQKASQVLIVAVLAIAAIPLIEQVLVWLKFIDLGESVKQMQDRTERTQEAMLTFKSPLMFIYTIFLFGVVPAVGEELFFRGLLMRFIHKRTGRIHFAVFLSATIFALFHGEPYSTFPILFMGMLLGYIYYFTGSIWLNILAHFLVNSVQVTLMYMSNNGMLSTNMNEMESLPWFVVVVALVVFCAFLYLLLKNKTPLPAGWSADYTQEEIAEKQSNG